jgi:GntR family transcriptional regulator
MMKKSTEIRQPAYRALAGDLEASILAGEFLPSRRLPTEDVLAETYKVSRHTVRQAFAQLVADGLVYRVRGRGSFATPSFASGAYVRSQGSVEDMLALSIDTELEVISPFRRNANVDAAARLGLDNDEVMEVTFRRLHHDEAFSLSTVSLPMFVARAIGGTDTLAISGSRSPATVISLIEDAKELGPIAGARQSITAVGAPVDVAPHIDCAVGDPVLRFDRLYFNRDGIPVELAIVHANPVRYAYRLELRRTSR